MTKIRFKSSEVEFARYIFREVHKVQTYTVYELSELEQGKRNQLAKTVRIEPYRNKSNAVNIDYYFSIKDATAWVKSTQLTGLRLYKDGAYYGDDGRTAKSLILFHLLDYGKTLVVDYFNSFYPFTPHLKFLLMDEIKKTLPEESALTDLKIQQLDLFSKDRNLV